jgi:endonuclease YncB( thermonuclease family)
VSGRKARLLRSQQIVAIDGDTLRVGSDRIRLRGIDTPELSEPGGRAARQRLEQLLQEGPIRIVPHGQDVYGRTVADVFVNGRNVAEVLNQEGYAKPR